MIIWALLAPLGSVSGGRSREATFWVVAFLLGAILSGVAEPYLRDSNDLPEALRIVLFVMNMTFVFGILFLLLDFSIHQKDTLIDVMQRNRELESAYLEQELTLRQNEKLATLGKLSAGLAHELNNPAAAAQQATQQLKSLLLDTRQLEAETTSLDLLGAEEEALGACVYRVGNRVNQPEFLDPLERSDREHAIQEYLEGAGVDDPVGDRAVGCRFGARAERSRRTRSQAALGSVRRGGDRPRDALQEAEPAQQPRREHRPNHRDGESTQVLYLPRPGPRRLIDVHEGLDSTLVMLQSRLKAGVEVTRSYAHDLPQIDGYGGELNQVWTNISDNAIDAMDGEGAIEISTLHSGDDVVIEVTDNGRGVSTEVAEHIFDPFVTTKAPGEGTGLGLNISHNIVTQKHEGEISMTSRPGATTFTIRLPMAGPPVNSQHPRRTEHASAGLVSKEE